MNAITPIPLPSSDGWQTANSKVNCWRGEAIHWLTTAEAAVTETLVALVPGTIHPFVRPRFNALVALLADDPQHARLVKALNAFVSLLEKRAALCHGVAKITRDRHGAWQVRLKWLECGKQPLSREASWDEIEAAAFLDELHRRAQSLAAMLAHLRASIPVSSSTPR